MPPTNKATVRDGSDSDVESSGDESKTSQAKKPQPQSIIVGGKQIRMRTVDMEKDGVEYVLDRTKCMEEGAMVITGLTIDKWPYKIHSYICPKGREGKGDWLAVMKHEDGNTFHYYNKTEFEPMLAEHNAAKAGQEHNLGRGGRKQASKKKTEEDEDMSVDDWEQKGMGATKKRCTKNNKSEKPAKKSKTTEAVGHPTQTSSLSKALQGDDEEEEEEEHDDDDTEDPFIAMLLKKAAAPIKSPIVTELMRTYSFVDLKDVESICSKYSEALLRTLFKKVKEHHVFMVQRMQKGTLVEALEFCLENLMLEEGGGGAAALKSGGAASKPSSTLLSPRGSGSCSGATDSDIGSSVSKSGSSSLGFATKTTKSERKSEMMEAKMGARDTNFNGLMRVYIMLFPHTIWTSSCHQVTAMRLKYPDIDGAMITMDVEELTNLPIRQVSDCLAFYKYKSIALAGCDREVDNVLAFLEEGEKNEEGITLESVKSQLEELEFWDLTKAQRRFLRCTEIYKTVETQRSALYDSLVKNWNDGNNHFKVVKTEVMRESLLVYNDPARQFGSAVEVKTALYSLMEELDDAYWTSLVRTFYSSEGKSLLKNKALKVPQNPPPLMDCTLDVVGHVEDTMRAHLLKDGAALPSPYNEAMKAAYRKALDQCLEDMILPNFASGRTRLEAPKGKAARGSVGPAYKAMEEAYMKKLQDLPWSVETPIFKWGSGKIELTVALSKWKEGLHTKALLY